MRIRWLARLLARHLPPNRAPDLVIGGERNPFLRRWHLIPRNRWFNLYCHTYHRSDDERANHDHPWRNVSFVLRGMLLEHLGRYGEDGSRVLSQGDIVSRGATEAHRLELLRAPPYSAPLTLFMTGPKVREWGFWCPNGWRSHAAFIAKRPGQPPDGPGESTIGVGCD